MSRYKFNLESYNLMGVPKTRPNKYMRISKNRQHCRYLTGIKNFFMISNV
jgi:hypothetical protein